MASLQQSLEQYIARNKIKLCPKRNSQLNKKKKIKIGLKRKKYNPDKKYAIAYKKKILNTNEEGLGSLYPVSFLKWRNGHRIKTGRISGIILWGLSDGTTNFVVIKSDKEYPLPSLINFSSPYLLINTDNIDEAHCQDICQPNCK